jgi:hypothetical protein
MGLSKTFLWHDTATATPTGIACTSLYLMHDTICVTAIQSLYHIQHPVTFDHTKQVQISFRFVSFRSPSLLHLLVHSKRRRFLFSLDHTQTHTTVGRTPLDEGSARCKDLYLITQTLYKRQTSMPSVGFEPMIPATAGPQTYTLDRAATGIGHIQIYQWIL